MENAAAAAPDMRLEARLVMRSCDRVALATALKGDGRPYVSLAAVASETDATPLLLFSTMSDHTKNLAVDARASLLFDGTSGFPNPQEGPRATLVGRIEPVPEAAREGARRRFLARHPGAALYVGFGDFAFYRVAIERVHWVGGFGRAAWLDGLPLVDARVAAAFAGAEAALVERSASQAEGLAAAAKLRGTGWRLAAIDPDGCELVRGKRSRRLAFAQPLSDPDQVTAAISALAKGAN
jgi:putative heme iron utilization protein